MKYIESLVVRSLLPVRVSSEKDSRQSASLQEAATETQPPLVERLRSGLPMAEFRCLLDLLSIPEEELGRLLGISPATLHRRKKAGHLGTPESERIVRFARLFGRAMEVFESELAARDWLKAPNPGTAEESPLSYADTEYGAREVENLLGRLEHGVFS